MEPGGEAELEDDSASGVRRDRAVIAGEVLGTGGDARRPAAVGRSQADATDAPEGGRRLAGTRGLAVNGGALIVNVLASGVSGFLFWIVAARAVEPAVVARATAMVTTMMAVVTLSQQSLTLNVPIFIARARRPKRLATYSYAAAAALTAVSAVTYVVFGPMFASGLDYIRELRLSLTFVLGCALWSVFSLQDAVLTGLRRGKVVLLENSLWGIARLVFVLALPPLGIALAEGWLVAAWLIPAGALVLVISHLLFVRAGSPLHGPLGDDQFDKRSLVYFLGVEHLTSVVGGVVALVIPAVALTTLGATTAAPFLSAYTFIVVTENAIASFAQAFAVEIRRNGHASRNLVVLTCVLLGAMSAGAIVFAKLFGADFMGLFGSEYRRPGSAVLMILVLGLPARCVWMLSAAANRLRGSGWKNFAQTAAYSAALFAGLVITGGATARTIAWCLVIARCVAAVASLDNLRQLTAPPAAPVIR